MSLAFVILIRTLQAPEKNNENEISKICSEEEALRRLTIFLQMDSRSIGQIKELIRKSYMIKDGGNPQLSKEKIVEKIEGKIKLGEVGKAARFLSKSAKIHLFTEESEKKLRVHFPKRSGAVDQFSDEIIKENLNTIRKIFTCANGSQLPGLRTLDPPIGPPIDTIEIYGACVCRVIFKHFIH